MQQMGKGFRCMILDGGCGHEISLRKARRLMRRAEREEGKGE